MTFKTPKETILNVGNITSTKNVSALQNSVIVNEDPALAKFAPKLVASGTLKSSVVKFGNTPVPLAETNTTELRPTDISATTTYNADKTLYLTNVNQNTNNQFVDVTQNFISGGVGSLNSLVGNINLIPGTNINIVNSGSNIEISTSGSAGTSGFSGFSGAQGAAGTSGFSGAQGAAGTSGFSGLNGVSGYSGSQGISGFSGAAGAGTPAGANTEIQYNNAGSFGASSALTWNNANSRLSVDGTEEVGPIHESFSQVAPAELTIAITFAGPPINAYVTNITIVSAGSGFTVGQQIFVPGTNLGGTSPANDRILTVNNTGPGGSIDSIVINSDSSPVVGTYTFNPYSTSQNTNIWYLSKGISSLNVNSINLAQNYCTNFLLVITQGATAIVPNSFSIDGTNVPLLYPDGIPITGSASGKDVVNISVFKTGASAYVAFAQLISFS